MTVVSPCITICRLGADAVCTGCGRTLDEIGGWTAMNDAEKRAVLARAALRRTERSKA